MSLPQGYRLRAFDFVTSTNDVARALVSVPEQEGPVQEEGEGAVVIWAGAQTAGRGRQGRLWHSPLGNLYATVVVRDVGPPATAAVLSLAAAVALAAALAPQGPESTPLRCKWPNDLLLKEAKVCGVLLEYGVTAARPWLLIGVGVNVVSAPTATPYPATALRSHGFDIALEDLLSAYLHHLDDWMRRWRREGAALLHAAWLAWAPPLGTPLVARLADGASRGGRFLGLDESGALRLERPDGAVETIAAGDVFWREGGICCS